MVTMKNIRSVTNLLMLGALVLAPVLAAPAVAAPAADEPPYEYVLTIDGQPVEVQENKTIKVTIAGREVEVKLAPRPYRVFHKAGVTFQFPRSYSFQSDLSNPQISIWTMNGNDVMVMVQHFGDVPVAAVLPIMVQEMVKQYGPKNVKDTATTITLDGRAVAGRRLAVTLAGQNLVQEVYAATGKQGAFVLVVQDAPSAPGKATDEVQRVKKQLAETFRFDK